MKGNLYFHFPKGFGLVPISVEGRGKINFQTWITREQRCKLSDQKDQNMETDLYFYVPKGFWRVPINESRGGRNVASLTDGRINP